jgi:hypothetical protein
MKVLTFNSSTHSMLLLWDRLRRVIFTPFMRFMLSGPAAAVL